MCLVNGDGSVDNLGLNGLLVDDWLDGLVNVVVNTFTSNGGLNLLSMLGLVGGRRVLELSSLALESQFDLLRLVVLDVTVLDLLHGVVVLLGQNLAVLDGLDGGVVMVLVSLLVDGSEDFLMSDWLDMFVDDGSVGTLVDFL